MYSLLLVDDESLELETLESYFDWSSFGIKVVATAKNGRDGLNKALEYKPEIIITDIKMPIMDGIEFSRKLREKDPDVKLIFLSGYNEVDYLKNALDVRAANYLLKPIDMNELKKVLSRVKEEIDKDKFSLEIFVNNYFKVLLYEEDSKKIHTLINSIGSLNIDNILNSLYYIITVYSKDYIISYLKEYVYYIDKFAQIIVENNIYIIIINTYKLDNMTSYEFVNFLKEYIHSNINCRIGIVYCEDRLDLNQVKSVFKRLSFIEDIIFYMGKNSIANISDYFKSPNILSSDSYLIEKKLTNAIFSYSKEFVYEVIDNYIELIIEKKYAKIFVLEKTFNLLIFICDDFLKQNIQFSTKLYDKDDLWAKLIDCEDINDVKEIILSYVEEIIDHIIKKKTDKNQYVVDRCIAYVENNFHKAITLDDLSKEIYLSPNYIRTIFKEKTGETFLEYLTNFRLIKANKLLKDKSLKVHEISNMVGYENTSYFCSIFQKKFGASPNDYRNKY